MDVSFPHIPETARSDGVANSKIRPCSSSPGSACLSLLGAAQRMLCTVLGREILVSGMGGTTPYGIPWRDKSMWDRVDRRGAERRVVLTHLPPPLPPNPTHPPHHRDTDAVPIPAPNRPALSDRWTVRRACVVRTRHTAGAAGHRHSRLSRACGRERKQIHDPAPSVRPTVLQYRRSRPYRKCRTYNGIYAPDAPDATEQCPQNTCDALVDDRSADTLLSLPRVLFGC